jgi:hypothetical protein
MSDHPTTHVRSLEQIMALTLEQVVARKDLADVRLATPSEIETLRGDPGEGVIRGTIRDWHVVAIENLRHFTSAFILGVNAANGHGYHTSTIVALDEGCGLVRTLNSLYILESRAEGDVPTPLVWLVCAAFHAQDSASGHLLGIPEISF